MNKYEVTFTISNSFKVVAATPDEAEQLAFEMDDSVLWLPPYDTIEVKLIKEFIER